MDDGASTQGSRSYAAEARLCSRSCKVHHLHDGASGYVREYTYTRDVLLQLLLQEGMKQLTKQCP